MRFILLTVSVFLNVALADIPIMEEIVVTATRSEKLIRVNPYSISLINADEIRRFSKDQLADVVADLPGVYISDAGQAGQKRIRIRGEEARRMALLVNGQEFTDHREVGVPLLVDPNRIQRIELVRGPASVLYGPKAMGGVINVITDRTVTEPFTADLSVTLNGATNGHLLSTQLFGMTSNGLQWNIGGFTNDQDLREAPHGKIENTAYTSDGVNLSISHNVDNHEWQLGYEQYRSDSDVYVEPEVRFSAPFRDFIIDIPRRDRDKMHVAYDYTPHADFALSVDAYQQTSDREFNTFPLMTLAPGLDTDTSILTTSDLVSNGINIQGDWQIGPEFSLITGVQWSDDDIDQLREREVKTNGIVTADETQRDQAGLESTALYIQGDATLTDRLSVLSGLRRYDVQSTTGNSDAHTIGSLAAIYSPTGSSALRFSWSQGYIYPSLLNLVVGAYAGSRFINPVATLQPETSDTYEIGYRLGSAAFSIDVAAFYTEADNYIDHVFCSTEDACPGRRDKIYKNIGEANSHGVELVMGFRTEPVAFDASVTWIQREKIYEGVDTWHAGVPNVSGHVSATYLASLWQKPLRMTLTGRFESDAKELKATRSGSNLTTHPGYGTFDLAMHYDLMRDTQVSVVLGNLTDKQYHSATQNLYAAGRHARVKLAVSL